MTILALDAGQVRQAADVDHKGRLGKTQLEQRDEALAARHDLGLLPSLPENVHRFRQGARRAIVKRGWKHAVSTSVEYNGAGCRVAAIAV